MPATYDSIASTTLGSSTGTVSFSSIVGTYTDLAVVITGTASANYGLWFRVNDDSGTNYSYTGLYGTGSSTVSDRASNNSFGFIAGNISTSQSISITHFLNYSNTTTNKTVISRGNDSAQGVNAGVSLWRSTSAINKITFAPGTSFPTGTFASGTTFTLFGIKAA